MEWVFRVSLFIAGCINFAPGLLVFAPTKFSQSYGIIQPEASLELLLRHRAVLFGIVGGLMLFSSLTKKYYDLATCLGMISMVSFVALFWWIDDGISVELHRVMYIDVFAIILLLSGYSWIKVTNKI